MMFTIALFLSVARRPAGSYAERSLASVSSLDSPAGDCGQSLEQCASPISPLPSSSFQNKITDPPLCKGTPWEPLPTRFREGRCVGVWKILGILDWWTE